MVSKYFKDEYDGHNEQKWANQNVDTFFLNRVFNWFLVALEYKISRGDGRLYFSHITDAWCHHDQLGIGLEDSVREA